MDIDTSFVESAAPNSKAVSNGRGLVAKGKFISFHISSDKSLIFGECRGSGAANYACSCDFISPSSPVYRCTCPSRQFPCKHCIGLMLAFVDGKKFTPADIPEDVESKRGKLTLRKEKQKTEASKPRKVNKAALSKKIKAQLDGLDLLERLTLDLIRSGMGNTTIKSAKQIEDQAKQLGNAFLPGAQSALHRYTKLFCGHDGKFESELKAHQRDKIYCIALDHLTRLNSLVKRGRKYLNDRLENPELAPETDTAIASWLGHAWQLRELKEAGLVEENRELVQLAFNSCDDLARREFVDTGIWMDLANGNIRTTKTYRPYKAAKYIKSEDSFFKVALVENLYVYPGSLNRRIRWEEMTSRPIGNKDIQLIFKHAAPTFAPLLKTIKTHLKSPLADKQPVIATRFSRIARLKDDTLVIEDSKDERIVFTETGDADEPTSCHLLWLLPRELLSDGVLVGRFHQDMDARSLRVKPLSLISNSQIFRLTL